MGEDLTGPSRGFWGPGEGQGPYRPFPSLWEVKGVTRALRILSELYKDQWSGKNLTDPTRAFRVLEK